MAGRSTRAALWALLALAPSGGATGVAAEDDPLRAYRWNARVLVIAAPDASDALYKAQRSALAAAEKGRAERDLVTLEALRHGARADALRRRLGLPADAFRVVLVGKDGGVKLSSDRPIASERLFAIIDAMPMRQDETKRR